MFSAFTMKSCKYRPIKFHCLLLLFPSVYKLLSNKRKKAIQNHVKFDNERVSNMCLPVAVSDIKGLKLRNMYIKLYSPSDKRLKNFRKRILVSLYLSVCPHGTTRLPPEEFE